jgi:hypothetical protein
LEEIGSLLSGAGFRRACRRCRWRRRGCRLNGAGWLCDPTASRRPQVLEAVDAPDQRRDSWNASLVVHALFPLTRAPSWPAPVARSVSSLA